MPGKMSLSIKCLINFSISNHWRSTATNYYSFHQLRLLSVRQVSRSLVSKRMRNSIFMNAQQKNRSRTFKCSNIYSLLCCPQVISIERLEKKALRQRKMCMKLDREKKKLSVSGQLQNGYTSRHFEGFFSHGGLDEVEVE
jgi:hypothetical protein